MARHWFVLATCVLLGGVMIVISGSGQAADPEDIAKAQKKVLEIADDIANKKNDDAVKKAKDYVKKEVNDYKDLEAPMKAMALRDNGGYGFGPKGSFTPDGIEAKLINLGRKPMAPKDVDAQADSLAKSANIMAAISEMALLKPPPKDADKTKWMKWAQDMKDGAVALSDAVAKKDPDAIKTASEKLNVTCADCHHDFKKK
jgi:hypothetical protein